jgi:hypothetical protein
MIAASTGQVFTVLEQVEDWPLLFHPNLAVRREGRSEDSDGRVRERLTMTALVGTSAERWVSQRVIDRRRWTISFQQATPLPPLRAMTGRWTVTDVRGGAMLALDHRLDADDDPPDARFWDLVENTDTNSKRELQDVAACLAGSRPTLATTRLEGRKGCSEIATRLAKILDRAVEGWSGDAPGTARQSPVRQICSTPDFPVVLRGQRFIACLAKDEREFLFKSWERPSRALSDYLWLTRFEDRNGFGFDIVRPRTPNRPGHPTPSDQIQDVLDRLDALAE